MSLPFPKEAWEHLCEFLRTHETCQVVIHQHQWRIFDILPVAEARGFTEDLVKFSARESSAGGQMKSVPRAVLECFQNLEPGVKARIVVNTNGKDLWKTEVTIFQDNSSEPQIDLIELIEKMHLALNGIVS